MAIFPNDICILTGSYGESFDPSVERTEMERGVPKHRLVNTQVLAKIKCSLLFNSSANVDAFEVWYFQTIGRIGWFTVDHPRTSAPITARFENGALGELAAVNNNRKRWRREVTLEYLR